MWPKRFIAVAVLLMAAPASAADGMTGIIADAARGAGGGQPMALSLQLLLAMTLLALLPTLLLMMTSFTRIIIVLAILRQALGLQQTPPNQVLIGMALFLSLFVMKPVIDDVAVAAYQPYDRGEITLDVAVDRAGQSLHSFMRGQTRTDDVRLFTKLAKQQPVAKPADLPFRVLIPAFITSELKTAFQIGFLIFLPFLIIDLVVACTLMALGMMMLSPTVISMPFKLLLFVLIDGWALTMGSLVASFG